MDGQTALYRDHVLAHTTVLISNPCPLGLPEKLPVTHLIADPTVALVPEKSIQILHRGVCPQEGSDV